MTWTKANEEIACADSIHLISKIATMRKSPPKNAFTLVELLMVMILLSLMGGMIVAAVQGVTRTAREARTKNIIAAIDAVLLEQYDAYKYRPFPVEIPDTFNPASLSTSNSGNENEIGFEVLSSEAARVRLMMVRDMQRMELPDRLSDIASAPALLRAAANPVLVNSSDVILNTRANKAERRMFNVRWYDPNASYGNGRDNVPSKLAAYRARIPSGFNFTAPESLANQGAECLYLIMSTSFVGGSPAIDAIPATNIGDTDGDGLPEILDGWERPLGFVRWPVGYFDFELSVNTTVPDDFDLFRSDYAYVVDPNVTTRALPVDVNSGPSVTALPWSMRPLVFSAGANGEYGIATNPWNSSGAEQVNFSYQSSSWLWRVDTEHFGEELPGRTRGTVSITYSNHAYPDPYLRQFVYDNWISGGFSGILPGQILSGGSASMAAEDLVDNITNYQLQASPR